MKVRQRAKQDTNQKELVAVIRQAGASWFDTTRITGGLDGTIGYAGIDVRCEIKNKALPPSARKLTEAEDLVFQTWRGRKPVILESVDDVLGLLKQMRHEANVPLGRKTN